MNPPKYEGLQKAQSKPIYDCRLNYARLHTSRSTSILYSIVLVSAQCQEMPLRLRRLKQILYWDRLHILLKSFGWRDLGSSFVKIFPFYSLLFHKPFYIILQVIQGVLLVLKLLHIEPYGNNILCIVIDLCYHI